MAVLCILITYIIKLLLTPVEPITIPASALHRRPKVKPRSITLEELKKFDGKNDDTPCYICIKGTVYDVSAGRRFYGKGGPYNLFCGYDSSRALAKGSLEKEDVENSDISDLTADEQDTLHGWIATFEGKYPVVAFIAGSAAEQRFKEEEKAQEANNTTNEDDNNNE